MYNENYLLSDIPITIFQELVIKTGKNVKAENVENIIKRLR